jgi:hypothetical protein
MRRLLIFLSLALIIGIVRGSCQCVELDWSRPETRTSPAGKWKVVVGKNQGGDHATTVSVESKAGGSTTFPLFRSACLLWSQDESRLAVTDMYSADTYRILLFEYGQVRKRHREIDDLIKRRETGLISPGHRQVYYFPRAEKWNGDDLVVTVGLVTAPKEDGSFTPHCNAYSLKTSSEVAIQAELPETQLKEKYEISCQLFP